MCISFFRREKLPERNLTEIKDISRILFIDDTDFALVEILNRQNWNVRWIKDVDNLDGAEIKDSHIIFVDVMGVGKNLSFKKEGLGLITALKEKHPLKKVIVYSAQTQNGFDKDFQNADAKLYKTSDPYEFQRILEKFAKELFSYKDVINRIRELFEKETGQQIDRNRIEKLFMKKSINAQRIAKKMEITIQIAKTALEIYLLCKTGEFPR